MRKNREYWRNLKKIMIISPVFTSNSAIGSNHMVIARVVVVIARVVVDILSTVVRDVSAIILIAA